MKTFIVCALLVFASTSFADTTREAVVDFGGIYTLSLRCDNSNRCSSTCSVTNPVTKNCNCAAEFTAQFISGSCGAPGSGTNPTRTCTRAYYCYRLPAPVALDTVEPRE